MMAVEALYALLMKNAVGGASPVVHNFLPVQATAFPPSYALAVQLPNARIEPAAAELR